MIDKKTSADITIFGVLKVVFGIIGCFPLLLRYLLLFFDTSNPKPPLVANIAMLSVGIFFISYIIDAIMILQRKESARKLSFFLDIAVILIYFYFGITQRAIQSIFDMFKIGMGYYSPSLLLFILLLIILPIVFVLFFTRPKVKERFR
jgi:hypothetical protein